MKKSLFSASVFFLFLLGSCFYVIAQEESEKPKRPSRENYRIVHREHARESKTLPREIQGEFTKITIRPTGFPDPLLKYRLHFYSNEKESGNAAFLYAEAHSEYTRLYNESLEEFYRSAEYRNHDPKTEWSKIESLKFRKFPLYPAFLNEHHGEITPEEEESFYFKTRRVYEMLERAARCRDNDWSKTYRVEGYATLLLHLDKTRTLGRYLEGKADWEIRNAKYEDAIRTLRIGFTLGNETRERNSSGLFSLFVGNAILRSMYHQVENLSAQPDAPNLYPALTQLRHSEQALLDAIHSEKFYLFPREVPWDIFDTIEESSAVECEILMDDLLTTFLEINAVPDDVFDPEARKSALKTAAYISLYPLARDRLLAKGVDRGEIEKMSTAQIVAPYFLEEIKRVYDDLLVISSFGRGESHTAIVFDEPRHQNMYSRGDAVAIFLRLLLPSFLNAKNSELFLQQRLDHSMLINALRFYAAEHGGRLPESLEQIEDVPVAKTDPFTGKPYSYRLEGNTAILDYTTYGLSRMEITLESEDGIADRSP